MKRFTGAIILCLIWLAACAPQADIPPTTAPEPVPSEPITSPVLRVVYSKNADPWIWTEGEGPRQVADAVNVMDVVLSSDGQVVAFKRDDTGEVFAVNADGSGLHPLVSADFLAGENAAVWRFDFAPESHTVYFTLVLTDGDFRPHYDLYRVDADAAESSPSLIRESGQGGIATFSPDGQWMTLYHLGGLDLARVDGSQARTIFTYPEGYEPATFGPEIVWMQDSSGFSVFHIADPLGNSHRGTLWFIPIAGEPVQKTTIDHPWALISPDGQRLGYDTGSNPNEIHIVEADGTDTLYAMVENGTFGGWLPDSQQFVVIFEVAIEGFYGLANQYSLGALGQALTPLTDTEAAYPVVWVAADRFLFISLDELRIQRIGEPSILLDEQTYNIFEYALVTP